MMELTPCGASTHPRPDCCPGAAPISFPSMMDGSHERSGEPEIATTTLAEIYVQQGLVDRALAIYRRLAERSPGDARVAERVVQLEIELERQHMGGGPEPLHEPPVLEATPPFVSELAEAPDLVEAPEPGEGSEVAEATEPLPHAAAEAPTRRSAPPVAEDREFQAWLEKR